MIILAQFRSSIAHPTLYRIMILTSFLILFGAQAISVFIGLLLFYFESLKYSIDFLILFSWLLAFTFALMLFFSNNYFVLSFYNREKLLLHPKEWLENINKTKVIPAEFFLSNGKRFFIDKDRIFFYIERLSKKNKVLLFAPGIISADFCIIALSLPTIKENSSLLMVLMFKILTVVILIFLILDPLDYIIAKTNVDSQTIKFWDLKDDSNEESLLQLSYSTENTPQDEMRVENLDQFAVSSVKVKDFYSNEKIKRIIRGNKIISTLVFKQSNDNSYKEIILYCDSKVENVNLILSVIEKWISLR
jgi:hypothetical protein